MGGHERTMTKSILAIHHITATAGETEGPPDFRRQGKASSFQGTRAIAPRS